LLVYNVILEINLVVDLFSHFLVGSICYYYSTTFKVLNVELHSPPWNKYMYLSYLKEELVSALVLEFETISFSLFLWFFDFSTSLEYSCRLTSGSC